MRTTDEIVKAIKRLEKKKDKAAQLDLWNVDYFRYSAMLDVLNGRIDDIERLKYYDRDCYQAAAKAQRWLNEEITIKELW